MRLMHQSKLPTWVHCLSCLFAPVSRMELTVPFGQDFEAGASCGADFDVPMDGGPLDDDSPPGSFDAAVQLDDGVPHDTGKEGPSNVKATKPRSRKAKGPVIDNKLSLSREEIEANRRSYSMRVSTSHAYLKSKDE